MRKVILNSRNGYNKKHDSLLQNLVNEKVLLFCAVGEDCELWHDVMDEIFVGDGEERNFSMITTWHTDETLEEVVEFARDFDIERIVSKDIEIIEV